MDIDTSDLSGPTLALYASESERRAIKLVELFKIMTIIVAWKEGRHGVRVQGPQLHSYFPWFAEATGMSRGTDLYEVENGLCRAVSLHFRAFNPDELDEEWRFWAQEPPSDYREAIMGRVRELKLFVTDYDQLVDYTRVALKKMGSLP
jgi:hypothetical protein